NQALPGAGTVASRRPYAGFGNITGGFVSSIGNSNYNALQIRGERRFGQGLSFVSSYTWSKSIDENAGISTGSESSGNAQNARNLAAERGLSDFDVNHRYVFSYVYDLPFGRERRLSVSNPVASALVSGWQLTGILTLQGGRPFTVNSGIDVSDTGGGNDRPDLIGNPRLDQRGPDRWFNTCTRLASGALGNCAAGENPVWAIPARGLFGSSGRNILRGDGLKNFDLGMYRSFRFSEGQSLQFRAEVFNLANHPNFFFPNGSVLASATGVNASFGRISRAAFQSQTGAQRQIQFALKYIF
ncbi:MAG: hypothetical protein ACREUU_05695, partial [Gammaproteobacteria bacterium]